MTRSRSPGPFVAVRLDRFVVSFRAAGLGFLLALPTSGVVAPAAAQIKPASSGQPSFNAPQMRRHDSGLYRPNRPKRHRYRYRYGYQPR